MSAPSTVAGKTRFIRGVHAAYRYWAHFVVRFAWPIIFLCSLATVACTFIVFVTPQYNELTGFTPYGARSLSELAIREEFFGHKNGKPFDVMILIMPKHGDNLLEEKLLAEIVRIDDFVRQNISIYSHATTRPTTYAEFCNDFCDLNQPLRNFYYGYESQLKLLRRNESLHPRIDLRYPVSKIFNRKFNIQPNFFDVEYSTQKAEGELTNMAKIRIAALIYKAERVQKWTDEEVKAYEMSISKYFEEKYKSENLNVMTMSTTYVEYEVVRAGMTMLPYLIVGFAIMAFCAMSTVLLSASYMNQCSIHKVSLAMMACICPLMACGTALGICFMCGLTFDTILCVTPFLVLAIGVDDAFLTVHCWQRVTNQLRRHPVKDDSVAYRLSLVLIETGPAVLISALTNVLADGVGLLSSSPAIAVLCTGNITSIIVDFVYQITLYTSVLAIVGEIEMRREKEMENSKSISHEPSISTIEQNVVPVKRKCYLKLVSYGDSFHDLMKSKFERFLNAYVKLVSNPIVAGTVVILWIVCFAVSLVGITKFEVNLTTQKMFAEDSPLLKIDDIYEEHIVPSYTLASVFVNNPGNLSDSDRLARLNSMVLELEHQPESWGPLSTNIFLRDFAAFEAENDDEEENENDSGTLNDNSTASALSTVDIGAKEFRTKDLIPFLKWPEYSYWHGFLHLENNGSETQLKNFFFTTAFHGANLRSWAERTRLLQRWRRIVDAHAEFNASVYHDDGIFLDVIDNMPSDAWQSAVATIACMALICYVFMFNLFTVCVTTAVIASIMACTLGMMSWQGVTMDPIMMAALIISIGFSVDIPAHVSYHYYCSGKEIHRGCNSVQDRLKRTFASVGFPAIQASLSSSLCVLSLLFVRLYMARIFVHITVSCIVLCLVHSLIVLPTIFTLIEYCRQRFLSAK